MTTSNFTRIGINTDTGNFSGVYDGGGYTITGLTITGTSFQGVFGAISGTVKNMNVTGTITQNGTGTNVSTGGIVGLNMADGTIDNCSFSGTVSGTGCDQVGGIVGQNNGTVINSRSAATISGRTSVGGIAGVNNGTIENSYNTGNITGTNQVGGIAGANSGTGSFIKIRNSYNTGDITATTTSTANAGGIIGVNQSSSTVEYCYNTGNVTGSTAVGGIAGANQSGSTLQNCVSLGARVTGTGSTNRVIGIANGNMNDNKARTDMKIGASGAEATVSGAATNSNGASVTVGTAMSTFFSGWDTTTIWNTGGNLSVGVNLPTLKTNTQTPAPTLPPAYVLGTAADPFIIATEADLRKVGTGTDGWSLSAYYKQTADIAVTSANNCPAIGSNANRFTGTYDGGGKTITGLTQVTTSSYSGIFGYIGEGGTVKNVTVTNGTITQNGSNTSFTGGITGYNLGTIDNCSFSGNVNGNTTNDVIGGIAGRNNGTVINSRSTATVSGRICIGGIVGENTGKIENSYNTGNVSGTNQIGGIAGALSGSSSYIKNSYNTGNVTATDSTSNVGGIAGNCTTGSLVEYCYNSGTVSGAQYVGGIVGTGGSTVTVQYCVSLSTRVITTTNSTYAGRISGAQGVTMTGNKARSDLLLGPSTQTTPVTTGTGSNKDGENVSLGTTVMNVFTSFDGSIWYIWNTPMNVGGDLPTLRKNEQSPAPKLP